MWISEDEISEYKLQYSLSAFIYVVSNIVVKNFFIPI